MEGPTTSTDKKVTGSTCNFCQEEKLAIAIHTDNSELLNESKKNCMILKW